MPLADFDVADLVSMNETFVRARTIFDRMMEESLTRHGMYDQPPGAYGPPGQPFARPESAYGYGAPGAYTTPAPGQYANGPQPYGYGPGPSPYGQPQPAYAAYGSQPYPGQPASTPGPQGSAPGQQAGPLPGQQAGPIPGQQAGPIPGQQAGPIPGQQGPIATQQSVAGPVQPGQMQQSISQSSGPAQQQQQPERQVISPYVYDPNTTYADPNVQAWAQYYAKGGKDLAGAVYFISVPGVTDEVAPSDPPPVVQQHQPLQQQPLQQQPVEQQSVEQQLGQHPAQQLGQLPTQQRQQSLQTLSSGGTLDVLPSPWPEDTPPNSSEPHGLPYSPSPPQQYASPLLNQYGPQQFSSPPPQQVFASASPQNSPVAAATTPSWVLPKAPRSASGGFGGGGQQGSYQGVGTTA
ncbi:hypothetical protein CPB85DRAFT_1347344 [Mucidula mucida]|nr:hypothetical protein CPB85DRAFT_1347344 [Mucidula mucida]